MIKPYVLSDFLKLVKYLIRLDDFCKIFSLVSSPFSVSKFKAEVSNYNYLWHVVTNNILYDFGKLAKIKILHRHSQCKSLFDLKNSQWKGLDPKCLATYQRVAFNWLIFRMVPAQAPEASNLYLFFGSSSTKYICRNIEWIASVFAPKPGFLFKRRYFPLKFVEN